RSFLRSAPPTPHIHTLSYTTLFRSLHPPHRRAPRHRPDGGGEGPAQRAEEPVRPPQDRGHLAGEGQVLAHDVGPGPLPGVVPVVDRKSTRLNSSHVKISYAVFCLKK